MYIPKYPSNIKQCSVLQTINSTHILTLYIYIVIYKTQNNQNVLLSIYYYRKQSVNKIIVYIQYIINTHFKARSATPRCHRDKRSSIKISFMLSTSKWIPNFRLCNGCKSVITFISQFFFTALNSTALLFQNCDTNKGRS